MEDKNKTSKGIQKRKPTNDLEIVGMGKIPPHASDLEQAVLGAMLLEKEAQATVIDLLQPEMFYSEAHQKIYVAMVGLFNDTQPIDLLTLTARLKQNGDLEGAGGHVYLVEITERLGSAAHIEAHSRIIIEKYLLRQLVHISSGITRDAFDDSTDVFDLLDSTAQNIFDLSDTNIRKNFEDIKSLMHQALDELEKLKDRVGGLTGVGSGFTELDRITSGWQRSEMIIVAARPGMGKTAFTVTMARNAAVNFNLPVAIFSLEMSSLQLVNRLISAETELPAEKLRSGDLAPHEWQQLQSKIGSLSQAPIYIDDTPGLNILELRAKCRRLKSNHKIELIIIDYLQLMVGSSNNKSFGNREQEIAQISRSLKAISKELNVPVIALSQLSRAPEIRGGDKRPLLSDLRESGSIEQDADMVVFLYRPEYYKIMEDDDGRPTNNLCEVIIAKHRNGSLGTVKLKFIPRFTKFMEFEESFDVDSNFEDFNPPSTITRTSKMNEEEGPPEAPF